MQLKEGWFERQADAATKKVASWPTWYRERMDLWLKIIQAEDETIPRQDRNKYGNY